MDYFRESGKVLRLQHHSGDVGPVAYTLTVYWNGRVEFQKAGRCPHCARLSKDETDKAGSVSAIGSNTSTYLAWLRFSLQDILKRESGR